MPRGLGAIGTASLIRVYFLTKSLANPHGTYKFLKAYLTRKKGRRRYLQPTYDSTRQMFNVLRRLAVIERVEFVSPVLKRHDLSRFKLGSKPLPISKNFYQIVEGKENDPAWRDPRKALWKSAEFAMLRNLPKFEINESDVREFILENGL
jgi:hypothetical protein